MLHHTLAALLLRDNLVPEAALSSCSEHAYREKKSFPACLLERNLIQADQLAEVCYHEYHVPWLDLSAFNKDLIPSEFISEKLIRKHHALPLYQRGNTLYIAVSDPTRIDALDDFQFRARLQTEAILVAEDKLSRLIDKVLKQKYQRLALPRLTNANCNRWIVTKNNVAKKKMSPATKATRPLLFILISCCWTQLSAALPICILSRMKLTTAFVSVLMVCCMK